MWGVWCLALWILLTSSFCARNDLKNYDLFGLKLNLPTQIGEKLEKSQQALKIPSTFPTTTTSGSSAKSGTTKLTKITSDDIENVYKEAFESLKTSKWDTCVLGICKNNIKIQHGSLSINPNEIRMEVVEDKIAPAERGFVFAPIKFTFPKNIIIISFKFEGETAGMKYKKIGEAKIKVGEITITVKAKLPNTKEALEESLGKGDCQYKLPSNGGVSTASKGDFDIDDVKYKPKTLFEYSKPKIIEAIYNSKNDIILNVGANLEKHIVQLVSGVPFSCLDDEDPRTRMGPRPDDSCPDQTCN